MRLCYLFYSEQIRSFKAAERSHSLQVKPDAALHCGLLTFVSTVSLLLIFCIIILKYLDCYYEKQGVQQPRALLDCKARAQTRTHLLPRTSLSIQKQWLVDGLMFPFQMCNRLKLSEAK